MKEKGILGIVGIDMCKLMKLICKEGMLKGILVVEIVNKEELLYYLCFVCLLVD